MSRKPGSAADMVLAARGLITGKRDVLTLAHRPGSPVVHLYVGPLAPSGRYAAARGRTVCHARTRRLTVLERDLGLLDHGRRVCHRCTARLSAHCRRVVQPVSRDQWLTATRGVELRDLVLMLAISTTVDETHKVGFLMGLLCGPVPALRPVEVSWRQALFDLNRAVNEKRRQLRQAERSPEQAEAAAYAREAQLHNDRLIVAGRRKAARIDRLTERRLAGSYLTPKERTELGMTG